MRCVPKTECPSGQTYLSQYGGCRHVDCPTTGQAYFSQYGGCRPLVCEHGRSSTGHCRTCEDPTHYHNGTECVAKTEPADGDPTCPAGQLYYGHYKGCRPSSCAHGRTSDGGCRPPPATTTTTATTTVAVVVSCPEGQEHFSEHGECRPVSCDGVRLNNGYCGETDEENPWYVNLKCRKYSAREDAEWYLNMNEDQVEYEGETLTKRIVTIPIESGISTVYRVTKADVEAYIGGGNCPVMGLFRAGMIQRGTDTGNGPGEVYGIQLAYDKSIYEGYPPGAKEPDIKIKAYGLVAVKPEPASDGCSHPNEKVLSVNEPIYDRRVPCQAHDYCYDLFRFTVAPSLSESDCDDKFHDLMNSDCADRKGLLPGKCSNDAWWWALGVRAKTISDEVHPGVVMIQNVGTEEDEEDMCVGVENLSDKTGSPITGTPLIQYPCEEDDGEITNRQFRFNKERKLNDNGTWSWYFQIRPEHINPKDIPSYCVSVTDNNNVEMLIPCVTTDPVADGDDDDYVYPVADGYDDDYVRAPSSSMFSLVEENASIDEEERYTIQNIDSPNRCWSPETSGTKARLINTSPCHRDSNLHLWKIKEVEE